MGRLEKAAVGLPSIYILFHSGGKALEFCRHSTLWVKERGRKRQTSCPPMDSKSGIRGLRFAPKQYTMKLRSIGKASHK